MPLAEEDFGSSRAELTSKEVCATRATTDTTSEVKDGMIAAILIEDETTLKRIYRRPEGLLLKSENPAFRDIKISLTAAARTRVMGVLAGIVRKV